MIVLHAELVSTSVRQVQFQRAISIQLTLILVQSVELVLTFVRLVQSLSKHNLRRQKIKGVRKNAFFVLSHQKKNGIFVRVLLFRYIRS
jgi:hypothetical protein